MILFYRFSPCQTSRSKPVMLLENNAGTWQRQTAQWDRPRDQTVRWSRRPRRAASRECSLRSCTAAAPCRWRSWTRPSSTRTRSTTRCSWFCVRWSSQWRSSRVSGSPTRSLCQSSPWLAVGRSCCRLSSTASTVCCRWRRSAAWTFRCTAWSNGAVRSSFSFSVPWCCARACPPSRRSCRSPWSRSVVSSQVSLSMIECSLTFHLHLNVWGNEAFFKLTSRCLIHHPPSRLSYAIWYQPGSS